MSGKVVRETLGFLGVIVSLVFVGLEVRQNSLSVQAATYQELISKIASLNLMEIENPDFGEFARAALLTPGPLDEADIDRMTPYLWLLFRHGDLAFSQYERGLLNEERLRSAMMPLSARLAAPWVQERWAVLHRQAFVPSYQSFVDSIIAGSQ